MTAHVQAPARPLGNRILIKRFQAKTSQGGILLPDSAQQKPKEGEVIAVGPGKMNDEGRISPMTVKVGDKVLFSSYAGVEVKVGDMEDGYLILSEDEVLGILN